MNEPKCPYCNTEIDIDHSDGHGISEGELHEQQCDACEAYFVFQTTISFSYKTKRADCLNGAKHPMKFTNTFPRKMTEMECVACGFRRPMTQHERAELELASTSSGTPTIGIEFNKAFQARLAYEKNCIEKYDRKGMNSITPKKGERLEDFARMFLTTPEEMKEILPKVEDELKRLGLE